MGPDARLLEILTPEDQKLAAKIMKAVEESFNQFNESCHRCTWWSGLKKNGQFWQWMGSKPNFYFNIYLISD